MNKDYSAITLSQLGGAKHDLHDVNAWRITPQRTGRVIFDRTNPRFPLKPAYDVLRESILRYDAQLGRHYAPQGTEVDLFDVLLQGSPRGDSKPDNGPV